jgi:Leucine-rich repeat (LRR) protein
MVLTYKNRLQLLATYTLYEILLFKKIKSMKTILLINTLIFAVNINAQIVNIPDNNFKNYLTGLPLNSNNDGEIQVSEASAFNGAINCGGRNIFNLTGIEAFTSITYLYCGTNPLTSLDVSQNTALTELYCIGNQLTSLDISKNTALTVLECNHNQLISLDVSKNTALTQLNCSHNQLKSLDVSKNTALTDLYCIQNQLTSLDVSQNTALSGLDCGDNKLISLDVSQNTALSGGLGCSHNQLISLDVSQNTALFYLDCGDNQLTSLDVSQNTALTELYCYGNQLTSLDVSQNTALTDLYCSNNQLTSLDVSQNTALTDLYCYENLLQCLNVKNGNNSNLVAFNAIYNTSLNCIEVDDAAWSTSNWKNGYDSGTSFSTNCGNSCKVGLEELSTFPKQLVKMIDLMGRETVFKTNTPIIFLYLDGTTERVFKFE